MNPRRSDLRARLVAHRPADATEASHREAMIALCDRPAAAGDPFARDHWSPGHFTASAFVLSPDRSALLFILHGRLGRWLQPGGHVDPDDVDIAAAACREVAEETGLSEVEIVGEGLFDVDIHAIPARKGDPEHQHLDVRVLLRSARVDAVAGSDARDARWVPLDEVDRLDTDESVRRAVRKLTRAG
jgi:8-oxo-dGTP pyrophosphatase MutT (NUDIX family)